MSLSSTLTTSANVAPGDCQGDFLAPCYNELDGFLTARCGGSQHQKEEEPWQNVYG
jgi:hypothetical protein